MPHLAAHVRLVITPRLRETAIHSWIHRASTLPVWLRIAVILFAALAFLDDLLSVTEDDRTGAALALMLLQITLSYGVTILAVWFPAPAVLLLPFPLVLSLVNRSVPSALIGAVIITLAATSLLPQGFILVHAAVLIAWVAATMFLSGSSDFAWLLSIPLAAAVLAGIAVRFFVTQQQQTATRLRNIEAAHQQLREQERLALARDLHDVVAHELTLITMQAAGSHRQDDTAVLHRTISTMEDAARSGVQELRKLLQVLRESPGAAPRDHASSGLATGSIESLLASLTASLETTGYRVSVHTSGDVDELPPTQRGTAARILQEATTNIMKYAPPGSPCCFEVTVAHETLVIRIENSLDMTRRSTQRIPPSLTSGFGLHGIQERVALLNGEANYGPRNGRWVLGVRIPFS